MTTDSNIFKGNIVWPLRKVIEKANGSPNFNRIFKKIVLALLLS